MIETVIGNQFSNQNETHLPDVDQRIESRGSAEKASSADTRADTISEPIKGDSQGSAKQRRSTQVEKQRRKWTTEDDELFRNLVNAKASPEDIAAKFGCSVQALKTRGYQIGLPLKWFLARRQ